MSIQSTRGTLQTVNTFVLSALKLAGLVPAGTLESDVGVADMIADGRVFLGDILAEAVANGRHARLVDFLDVSLAEGQGTYTLDPAVLDIIGSAQYTPPDQVAGSPTGATSVKVLSREEWMRLSDKASLGQPTQLYPHKGGDDHAIDLLLYPVPEEAGTLTVQATYKAADVSDGLSHLDLQPSSMNYIRQRLAVQLMLSSNSPLDKVSVLSALAAASKWDSEGAEAEAAPPGIDLRIEPAPRRE